MPPAHTWPLQDAKNHFSQVVEESLHHGPQLVTRHGKETAVVMSFAEYQKMSARKDSLVEFFRKSPLCGVKLNLSRDRSPVREGPSF